MEPSGAEKKGTCETVGSSKQLRPFGLLFASGGTRIHGSLRCLGAVSPVDGSDCVKRR